MTLNNKLEGLAFDDFSRLHSLNGIQTAPILRYLHFGDRIWNTSSLTDLTPLIASKLVGFRFLAKKIENIDLSIFTKMPNLKYLDFAPNLLATEQIAQIMTQCPEISGYALRPFIKLDRKDGELKDILICGKRKPFLFSNKDSQRIEEYTEKFNKLVEQYTHIFSSK
jgi:hypothetical protein